LFSHRLPLIDVVSAAQTPLAQTALMEFLNFDGDDYKISEPERYLLATALSTHPPEQVIRDLLVRSRNKYYVHLHGRI